ncbi:MAG: hypothetical protein RJQ09_01010 [Cyclobacteriaceae bacterium]
MKKIWLIIGLVVLIISVLLNVLSIYALLFNFDFDKEVLRDKTYKINVLNKSHQSLSELNKIAYDSIASFDHNYEELLSIIDSTYDKIKNIEELLITTTGGVTISGEFFNPKAKPYIDRFFFTRNENKTEGQKLFDDAIVTYIQRHSAITGTKSELMELYSLYDIENRQSPVVIFMNLTLAESQSVLDELRTRIELDKYRYLISLN